MSMCHSYLEFMNIITIVIIIACSLVLYTSGFITYHMIKSDYFDRKQKVILIAVAWLIPVIGPALIFSLLAEDKTIKKKGDFHLLDHIFLTAVLTQNSSSQGGGSDTSSSQSSSSDSDT